VVLGSILTFLRFAARPGQWVERQGCHPCYTAAPFSRQ